MKTAIFSVIVSILAVLLIPRVQSSQAPPQDFVLVIEQPRQEQTVRLLHDGGTEAVPLEEYLCCVLLSEMPAEFPDEALKAQTVAARTFLEKHRDKHENADICGDPGCCQAWTPKAELEKKFGSGFAAVWEKAEKAVTQTMNEVLTYDHSLIDATYFSCTGGKTEAAVAVWGSDVPYLQSVESYGEEKALRRESSVVLSQQQVCDILKAASAELSDDPKDWFGDAVYTEGGGVDTMQIGNAVFTGVQLRQMFGLNSTQFTVAYQNGDFTFSVKGFGHRVGMSQYGAAFMAENGCTYPQILRYYYRGTRIEKLP